MTGFAENLLLAASIATLISTSLCQVEDLCTTPDNTPGNCIILFECKSLYAELQSASGRRALSSIHEKLKKYNCGYEKFDPKVCCPIESPTIDTTTEKIKIETKIDIPPDVTNHPNIGLLTEQCGSFLTDRITNGMKTELNEFPWMVLISYNIRGEEAFRCGGTIINTRYILTAAHCITGPSTENISFIRIGEHDLRTVVDCKGPKKRPHCAMPVKDIGIEEVIPHPGYSRSKLADDIGLLRLKEPIDLINGNAESICLPLSKDLREFNLDGQNVTVAGWGVTENGTSSPELLKVVMPVVTNAECREIFKRTVISGISNKQLCAGGVNGQDSCSGDSGGPLKFPNEMNEISKYIQHGIVSFGSKNCGTVGTPGVYTRVAYYMDWILDQLKP